MLCGTVTVARCPQISHCVSLSTTVSTVGQHLCCVGMQLATAAHLDGLEGAAAATEAAT
jgi:hypothetical protein